MSKKSTKILRREIRRRRVRSVVSGTSQRPRLSVFRSLSQIYAQLIDDVSGKTLASANSLEVKGKGTKSELATKVGELIAKKALDIKVSSVVFDRGGYQYHGRVKALAEAARNSGLEF
jgi:large subunit ribosomal protein L18